MRLSVAVFFILLPLLAGCLRQAAPATRLTALGGTAAPAAAGAKASPMASEPKTWWTTAGGYRRLNRAQNAGPQTYHVLADYALPSFLERGPFFDAHGDGWLLAAGALYRMKGGRQAPEAASDRDKWIYLDLALCPGGGMIVARAPGRWEPTGAYKPLKGSELARLDAGGKEAWTWPSAKVLITLTPAPDGSVYCLSYVDPYTDKHGPTSLYKIGGGGKPVWELAIEDVIGRCPQIALDDAGNLFFASASGVLYSVDPAGGLRFSYAPSHAFGQKRYARFGQTGLVMLTDGGAVVYSAGNDGRVSFLAGGGQLLWSFRPRRDFSLAMGLTTDSKLYVTDHLGWFYRYDQAGACQSQKQISDFGSAPLVLDSRDDLYLAPPGWLEAFDATGKELWSTQMGDFVSYMTIVPGGLLYVATMAMGGSGAAALVLVGQ